MIMGAILGNYVTGIIAYDSIFNDTTLQTAAHDNLVTQFGNTNPFANISYLLSANLLFSLM
jgi:hypothetical protein